MKYNSLFFSILSIFLIASCAKPTTESETKRWESHQKTLQTLSVKYPSFKNALTEVERSAAQQWEAALKVGDEEQKIAAMQTANSAAYPEFVRKLDYLEGNMDRLQRLCRKTTKTSADRIDMNALRTARDDAERTLSDLRYSLSSRVVNSPVEAEVAVEEISKNIKYATDRINKVMKRIADKERKQKQEEKAEKDKQNADKQSKEISKSVKCSYCGSKNKAGTSKCKSCGAPLK